MNPLHNDFKQPIGEPLTDWKPPAAPDTQSLEGRACLLEPLDADAHAEGLYEAFAQDKAGKNWTYLPYGPFASFTAFRDWLRAVHGGRDPLFYVIRRKPSMDLAGVASYLRINPSHGSIEVGHIHFSESLKRGLAATEAMYLMMKRAFDLGYRRYEWKCDALNAASRSAAQRLGLSFEGVFRNATVYKGRSRDTAWFAAIDSDWPALQSAFKTWLGPDNFDAHGRQKQSLRRLTCPMLKNLTFVESPQPAE